MQLAPDVQIPQSVQYSVGVDHQLQKSTTLSITYTGARGYHLFRSRDVNAPPPPFYAARPDPAYGAIRQVESNGRQESDSLQRDAARPGDALVQRPDAVHAEPRRTTTPTASTRFRPTTTTCPASGRARISIAGTASCCSAASARHQGRRPRRGADAEFRRVPTRRRSAATLTTTAAAARGRRRRAQHVERRRFASLDLRASRDLKLGGPKSGRELTLGLDAFNVLNRVNYGRYVGTLSSPLFGPPVSARSARQLQFSIRFKF